jgi:hypothetical protein
VHAQLVNEALDDDADRERGRPGESKRVSFRAVKLALAALCARAGGAAADGAQVAARAEPLHGAGAAVAVAAGQRDGLRGGV